MTSMAPNRLMFARWQTQKNGSFLRWKQTLIIGSVFSNTFFQSTSMVSSPSNAGPGCSAGTPLPRPASSSLLISGAIFSWPWFRSRSSKASRWSSVTGIECKYYRPPLLCEGGTRVLTIIAIPLRKYEHALVEDYGQWPRSGVALPNIPGGRGVPEEMEDKRVHTLPRCRKQC